MTYTLLHRIDAGYAEPTPIVIRVDAITAVMALPGGPTRLYLKHVQNFWDVAEDEETVLRSIGFFNEEGR